MNEREQVEKAADRIRDELILTLQELDSRRGHALDLRYQVDRHRDALLIAGGVTLLLTGISAGIGLWRRRHREQVIARRRWQGLKRAWHHPERLASSAEERPLAAELGKKLVMIFSSALATQLARKSVQTLVPVKPQQRRAQAYA